MASKYNESIVFLIMETGWTLEYIRALPLPEFWTLVKEIRYQRRVRDYERDILLALLAAPNYKDTIARDIIGEPPQRESEKREELELWVLATRMGIRIPAKR